MNFLLKNSVFIYISFLFFCFESFPTSSCQKNFLEEENKAIPNKVDSLLIPELLLVYDHKADKFLLESNKAVGVLDGKISFIIDAKEASNIEAKNNYQLKNHLLAPGLVNTHTHLPMSLMRALVDSIPLAEWLRDYVFAFRKEVDR